MALARRARPFFKEKPFFLRAGVRRYRSIRIPNPNGMGFEQIHAEPNQGGGRRVTRLGTRLPRPSGRKSPGNEACYEACGSRAEANHGGRRRVTRLACDDVVVLST